MVSGLKSHDYDERLKELEMPTLTQRREELDMTEMFKIMTKKSTVDPNIWFEKASRDGVMTRQAADPLNVMIPAARLDMDMDLPIGPMGITSQDSRRFKKIYRNSL